VSQAGGKQIVLRWPSVADKNYNVWFTPNLSSPFTVISSNVPATPPFNNYQQAIAPGGSGYYRIEAR
jgi:hypothetical protein